MSNVIKLTEIGKVFESQKELSNYCTAQYVALEAAAAKIKTLTEEVEHLQKLLATSTKLIGDSEVTSVIKSPELALVEEQILKMATTTKNLLTLEEVKILDLLIKNKNLLSGEATTIEARKKPKKEYTEAQLISLASKLPDGK